MRAGARAPESGPAQRRFWPGLPCLVLALWVLLGASVLGFGPAAHGQAPVPSAAVDDHGPGAHTSTAPAVRVQDERGIELRLPVPPQRIVSLLPSLTEAVCVLGACERLVGTDRYSNWPRRAEGLPKVGGGIDPDVEAIVALRPDLVLLARSSRAVQRLAALGLPVLVLEPHSQADTQRVLRLLAQALSLTSADAVLARIDEEVRQAAAAVPPRWRASTVYFEVGAAPYAAAPGSFIGETLDHLGLVNIVPAGSGPFPKLNPEYVVRADPQLIMASARSGSGLAQRPGWSRLQAVRERHVCLFDVETWDMLVRPGPRLGEAARRVVACLEALP